MNPDGQVVSRSFSPGQIVEGEEDFQANTGLNHTPLLCTSDGWKIPLANMRVENESELIEAVESSTEDDLSPETLKRVENLRTNAKNIFNIQGRKSKYTANGAMIGAAISLGYAMAKRKQGKLFFVLIGSAIGAVVGQIASTYKKTES